MACQKQQYRHAAALLQSLSQTFGLSSEQIAYCQQQRQICLDHLKPVSASRPTGQVRKPVPRTPEGADCGPSALLLVCQRLDVKTSLERLRQTAGTTERGTSLEGLAKAAKAVGLKAEGVQVNREGWNEVQMPALAWVNRNHYVAVLELMGEGEEAIAVIHDPNEQKEKTIAREQLLRLCGGYLLLLNR
jgi:ABC-type bacteriocin/lantibiotic exporter with double-glycine peptidase domain